MSIFRVPVAGIGVALLLGVSFVIVPSAGAHGDDSPTNLVGTEAACASFLAADGADGPTDFFPPHLDRAYVFSVDGANSELSQAADAVIAAIAAQYDHADFEARLIEHPDAVVAGPNERTIVIDNDLGVPGQPRVYPGKPDTTLFVHWTEAARDVRALLALADCSTINSDSVSQHVVPVAFVPLESDSDPGSTSTAQHPGPSSPDAGPASPDPGYGTASTAVWDLGGDGPHLLSGYTDSESFELALPAGWQMIGDANFSTNVVASEIARADMSLRLDVAGRPATTWTLADTTAVNMSIPAELFSSDSFEIEAHATTPIISEVECFDPGHVGRWVDLGAPRVTAMIMADELDVARSIAGIGPVSALTGEPVSVIVDGPVEPAKLEIIGSLAAAIGHYGEPAGWNVLPNWSQVPDRGSIIVISTDPGRPGEIATSVSDGRAVINLVGREEELGGIARALADPDRLLFFHGSQVSFDEVPTAASGPAREVFSFDAAGYGDRTLRGSGAKSLVYRLHIPSGVLTDSATLALYGTYAPVLAEYDASLSVRINGGEEQIIAVLDDSGQIELLNTVRPANLRPGLNYVRVTIQLGEPISGCTTHDGSRWMTISKSSALGVERLDDPQPVRVGVEDARFALANGADFEAADVVLPDTWSPSTLNTALQVISQFASKGDGGAPRLVTDANADTSRHLIVVGEVGEPGDRALLGGLPYVEAGRSVGVIAALPSVYTPGRVFLAFTGGTPASADLASEAAMAGEVQDVATSYALVSIDTVRSVGEVGSTITGEGELPTIMAHRADNPAGPPADEYEAWLLEQAARIEGMNAPQTNLRRMVAFGLLMFATAMGGLGWIRRARRLGPATPGH